MVTNLTLHVPRVPPEHLLELLGRHPTADLGVTLRVYAHLDPKRAKAAAGRIDAALGRRLVDSATG